MKLIDNTVNSIWPVDRKNGTCPRIQASHLERRRPAGFQFAVPLASRIQLDAGLMVDSNAMRMVRFHREACGQQFRPVPVLANGGEELDARSIRDAIKAQESTQRKRTGSVMLAGKPAVHRTLAAGRIQFTSRSEHSMVKLTKSRMQMSRFVGSNLSRVGIMAAMTGRYFNFTELHCHSGQTRAVYGGTRSVYPGQTQQPNAVQIAIT